MNFKEEAEKFATMLIHMAGCLRYYNEMSNLPNCNTCGKQQTCEYVRKPGEPQRINCPLWEEMYG